MGRDSVRAITISLGAFAVAFLLAVVGLAFNVGSAQAIYTQMEVDRFASVTRYVMLDIATADQGPNPNEWSYYDPSYSNKLAKATSSNPKVVKVAHPSKNGFTILMKKPGKATVTYKFKGKKYVHKFVVLKYSNPAKVFKVGSKNYASKFDKSVCFEPKKSLAGKKLVLKPNPGWKIQQVFVNTKKSSKTKTPPFKIAKSHTQVTVLWENKKGAVIASNLLP